MLEWERERRVDWEREGGGLSGREGGGLRGGEIVEGRGGITHSATVQTPVLGVGLANHAPVNQHGPSFIHLTEGQP